MQTEATNIESEKANQLEMATLKAKQNHLEYLKKQLEEIKLREKEVNLCIF